MDLGVGVGEVSCFPCLGAQLLLFGVLQRFPSPEWFLKPWSFLLKNSDLTPVRMAPICTKMEPLKEDWPLDCLPRAPLPDSTLPITDYQFSISVLWCANKKVLKHFIFSLLSTERRSFTFCGSLSFRQWQSHAVDPSFLSGLSSGTQQHLKCLYHCIAINPDVVFVPGN